MNSHDWLVVRGGPEFRLGAGIDMARHHEILQTLCGFLNEHDLVIHQLPTGEDHDWEGFTLRFSGLNERGVELAKKGLPRWLAALDRGTRVSKTTVLENALRRIDAATQGDRT